jgi:hypothetical protein
MPKFHQRSVKALLKANAPSDKSGDVDLVLDYDPDPRQAAANAQVYTNYMRDLRSFAASTYPYADAILHLVPGTRLPDTPRPEPHAGEDSELTDAIMVKEWMAERGKRKEQLKQLHGSILSSMTSSATEAVSRDPLWLTHTLARADIDTLHHLLNAIHLTYMTRRNVSPEQAVVDALIALLTEKQTDDETMAEYKRSFNTRVELVRSISNKQFTGAELAVMFMNGLNPKFDVLKGELQRASSITSTYVQSVDDVTAALLRLDYATSSTAGTVSAFAAHVTGQGKSSGTRDSKEEKDTSGKFAKLIKDVKDLKMENGRLKRQIEDGERGKGEGHRDVDDGGAAKGSGGGKKGGVGFKVGGGGSRPNKDVGQMSKAAGTSKKNQTIAGGTEFYDPDDSEAEEQGGRKAP